MSKTRLEFKDTGSNYKTGSINMSWGATPSARARGPPSDKEPSDQVRETVRRMGGRGLKGISRIYKRWDIVGARKMEFVDFKNGLHDCGCFLSDKDIMSVMNMWDLDGNGQLGFDDFLIGMKGDLNTSRRKHVDAAFNILDTDGGGTIDLREIKSKYNAKEHKDVKNGSRTEDEILLDVMHGFEGPKGNNDGLITREEFNEYYKGVSANIDSDRFFGAMMESAWNTKKYAKGDRVGSARPSARSARATPRGSRAGSSRSSKRSSKSRSRGHK